MEETKKAQNFHPGLALFRLLMCFEVVLCHFWEAEQDSAVLSPLATLREIAVPCFVITAFYLGAKSFLKTDRGFAAKRLTRLVWPQIAWAFIYYLVYVVSGAVLGLKMTHGPMDLVWQLLTGHSPQLNASMWYQFVLIVLTLLFLGLFAWLPRKGAVTAVYALSAAALLLQYTGTNLALFGDLLFEARYPLGRILEMLPYAGLGFFLSVNDVPKRLVKYRLPALIGGFILGWVFLYLPLPEAPGFGYQGLPFVLSVCCFFLAFLLLPLENISDGAKDVIRNVSDYTLGIYCVHRLVATFLFHALKLVGITGRTFLLCLLLYVCSYFVSFLLAKLPWKWSRLLVK